MSTSNAQNPTKFPFVSCYWFIGIKYIASCSESIRPRIFLSKISNWNNLREQNRSTILSPFSLSLVLSRVKSNFSSNFLLENSKSWKKSKKRNKKKKRMRHLRMLIFGTRTKISWLSLEETTISIDNEYRWYRLSFNIVLSFTAASYAVRKSVSGLKAVLPRAHFRYRAQGRGPPLARDNPPFLLSAVVIALRAQTPWIFWA